MSETKVNMGSNSPASAASSNAASNPVAPNSNPAASAPKVVPAAPKVIPPVSAAPSSAPNSTPAAKAKKPFWQRITKKTWIIIGSVAVVVVIGIAIAIIFAVNYIPTYSNLDEMFDAGLELYTKSNGDTEALSRFFNHQRNQVKSQAQKNEITLVELNVYNYQGDSDHALQIIKGSSLEEWDGELLQRLCGIAVNAANSTSESDTAIYYLNYAMDHLPADYEEGEPF